VIIIVLLVGWGTVVAVWLTITVSVDLVAVVTGYELLLGGGLCVQAVFTSIASVGIVAGTESSAP